MYAIQMKMTVEETSMDKNDKIAAITASNLPEALKAELLSKLIDNNEIERQRLNDAVRKEIVEILLSADHGMTVSELRESSPFLSQCSTQKISNVLSGFVRNDFYKGYSHKISPIMFPEIIGTTTNENKYKVYPCKRRITEVRTYTHPDGSVYTVKANRVAHVWCAERV